MFALGLCQSFKFILDSSDFDNKFSRVLELFLPALIIKQSNWFFVRSKTLTNYCQGLRMKLFVN